MWSITVKALFISYTDIGSVVLSDVGFWLKAISTLIKANIVGCNAPVEILYCFV